jgi:hypothetical protein
MKKQNARMRKVKIKKSLLLKIMRSTNSSKIQTLIKIIFGNMAYECEIHGLNILKIHDF